MISIFRKEVGTFFNGIIGYVVVGVFLLLSGLIIWVYPNSNVLDYGYAELNVFFDFCPYVFLFLIPAVTMRMFAEEFRAGTIELLFTKPISIQNIILGKYFASLFIIILAIIPTVIYYFSIYYLGNPVGNIDSASVLGSYFGLIFLAAAYSSIGIFTSAITKNQVVSFILAAVLCYFFYDGIGQIASLFRGTLEYYITYIGLNFHYASLGKGLIDSRNMLYLFSFSSFFLILTTIFLKRRRH
jgi:ABC-2 type transport system permease protein